MNTNMQRVWFKCMQDAGYTACRARSAKHSLLMNAISANGMQSLDFLWLVTSRSVRHWPHRRNGSICAGEHKFPSNPLHYSFHSLNLLRYQLPKHKQTEKEFALHIARWSSLPSHLSYCWLRQPLRLQRLKGETTSWRDGTLILPSIDFYETQWYSQRSPDQYQKWLVPQTAKYAVRVDHGL